MGRFLRTILVALLLALPAPVAAQGPGQAPANPAAPGAVPPTIPNAPEPRNSAMEHIAAFGSMILLMLLVCYPSRRY